MRRSRVTTKKQTIEQLKKRIVELPVNSAGCRRHYPERLKKTMVAFVEERTRQGTTQQMSQRCWHGGLTDYGGPG